MKQMTEAEIEQEKKSEEFVADFEKAMEDDFNTADAITAIFELVKFANTTADGESSKVYTKALLDRIVSLCDILGLIVEKRKRCWMRISKRSLRNGPRQERKRTSSVLMRSGMSFWKRELS